MRKKRFFTGFLASLIATPILIASFIWVATYIEENNGQRIPILMYHQLITSPKEADYYHLPISEFEKQLAWLKENNFHTINLDTLSTLNSPQRLLTDRIIKQEPRTKTDRTSINNETLTADCGLRTNRPVILTFDDGTKDHYKYAYPLLKKYNYTATFFIVSSHIDTILTREEIKEMSEANIDIQSHTHTHKYLDRLDDLEIKNELYNSKTLIESITGKSVNSLAIPGGWYDRRVIDIAKEMGYKSIFTSDIGTNPLEDANLLLKRIDVPGTTTLDKFPELFFPSKIAFDKTFRDVRLVIRKCIGPSIYTTIWQWYHHPSKISLIYILIGCTLIVILIITPIAIKKYK